MSNAPADTPLRAGMSGGMRAIVDKLRQVLGSPVKATEAQLRWLSRHVAGAREGWWRRVFRPRSKYYPHQGSRECARRREQYPLGQNRRWHEAALARRG